MFMFRLMIYLYDLKMGLVDMLPTLNTEYDEVAPTVDDGGTTVAYVLERGGYQTLGLHDLTTGRSFVPTVVAQLGDDVRTPWLSGDGDYVAFAADVDYTGWDIFVYDVEAATLISPPFVNSPDDEMDPALNADGSMLVFATDRMGSDDIMLAELTTGVLDRLMLANSPYDERSPRFLGGDEEAIVFNTDRSGDRQMMLFHPGAGVIDTLPIMHEIGADDEMVDQSSSAGGIGGGLFGRSLGGRGGIRGGIGRFW
jgi:Tol biopolymer transport system component